MGSKLYRGIMFVLPLMYSIQTRFLRRSRLGMIVWVSEYLIPVMLAMLILDIWSLNLIKAILSVIAVYNLYEIGYIQNDCETIKHEEIPTKRLSNDDLEFYEEKKVYIYATRLFLGFILTWFFYEAGVSILGLIAMWLVIPYYLVYNYIRGRINLFLILPLTGYRYCFPIFLYGCMVFSEKFWFIIICMFFAYPFPTFIEICSDGKGNLPEKWTLLFLPNFEGRFIFRIKYYFIMTLLCLGLSILGKVESTLIFIPLYYLFDRIPQLKMNKLGGK